VLGDAAHRPMPTPGAQIHAAPIGLTRKPMSRPNFWHSQPSPWEKLSRVVGAPRDALAAP